MSEFKSATTDFAEIRKRTEELFGEPWYGTREGAENGVDTTKREELDEAARADSGHYPGY